MAITKQYLTDKIFDLYSLGSDFGNPEYPDDVWVAYRELQNALLNLRDGWKIEEVA